jgi:hypothetical protein
MRKPASSSRSCFLSLATVAARENIQHTVLGFYSLQYSPSSMHIFKSNIFPKDINVFITTAGFPCFLLLPLRKLLL